MRIYIQDLRMLLLVAVLLCAAWKTLLAHFGTKWWFRTIDCALIALSLYGVLRYTVLGRTGGEERLFSFFAPYSNEFFREMFMNALLYLPLGLSLSVFLGWWSVPTAFLLSLTIEAWQYFAGTGWSQGTDTIMNALGCLIGAVPAHLARRERE